VLQDISSPTDLEGSTYPELGQLAREIRNELITKVSATGGHLGPNLGVVELSIAIHRVFHSPKDVVIFDTGHQSYVHKMLTGRAGQFSHLRQRNGLAGYPSRAESDHDVVENSHASTALSWGDGISHGFAMQGEVDRSVVVVVGDGALTGGMSWEALNNISVAEERNLVIILNDNERSYSPTIGGIARHLRTLRQGLETSGIFRNLGLEYSGPIDGHDIESLESALAQAKNFGKPILLHVVTEKGRGYDPALLDEAEKFHAIGIVNPETGIALKKSERSWTQVFGDELAAIGSERSDVVAISAAMIGPTGLSKFQSLFPERTIDVGIAEQHAVASAAGLAFTGLHPVVAVYATFLNRAFDQLLLDVSLHNAGVTFVLDRSGITGDDGASHNGMWDLALTGIIPSLHVAAPRDGAQLQELLRQSLEISDAPSLVRFPKGAVNVDIPAIERIDGMDFLVRCEQTEILLISIGAFAPLALEIAREAEQEGIHVSVLDPRWVKPLSPMILGIAAQFSSIAVIEDGIRHGGIASTLSEMLRDAGMAMPVQSFGVPLIFLEHAKRSEILDEIGLTVPAILQRLRKGSDSLFVESLSADRFTNSLTI